MWSVTIPLIKNRTVQSRIVTSTTQNILPIDISGILFNISRFSINGGPGTLPVVSLLSVINTADLNGTKVGCLAQFSENNSIILRR